MNLKVLPILIGSILFYYTPEQDEVSVKNCPIFSEILWFVSSTEYTYLDVGSEWIMQSQRDLMWK